MQRMNDLMRQRGEYEAAQREAASYTVSRHRPGMPQAYGSMGGVYDRAGNLQPSDYVPPDAEEIMLARRYGIGTTGVRMSRDLIDRAGAAGVKPGYNNLMQFKYGGG